MTRLRLYLESKDNLHFSIIIPDRSASAESTLPFNDKQLKCVFSILNDVSISVGYLSNNDNGLLRVLSPTSNNWSEFNHTKIIELIGSKIFEALFPGQIGQALTMESNNDFLNIQVCYSHTTTQDSLLSLYPWHLSYNNHKFLSKENILFSYVINNTKQIKKVTKKQTATIILIGSDASESRPGSFSPRTFQSSIEDIINSNKEKFLLSCKAVYEKNHKPTLEILSNFITEYKCNAANNNGLIINFYGHGVFKRICNNRKCASHEAIYSVDKTHCQKCQQQLTEPKGYLQFQKSEGTAVDYVSSENFANQFKLLQHKPILAIITACYSALSYKCETVYNGVAQRLVDCGIPIVIAFPFRFSQESAQSFIQKFYQSLSNNDSVFTAFKSGVLACKEAEWYRPVLFVSNGIDDGILFEVSEDKSYTKPNLSPQHAHYYLSINPLFYQKIINAYTCCQVFSKEINTIFIIFRTINIKQESDFNVYIQAIKAAKDTFKLIPNLENESVEFRKICAHDENLNLKNYYKNYNEVNKFLNTQQNRKFTNSNIFAQKDMNKISHIINYNDWLESFWYKLYSEYLLK